MSRMNSTEYAARAGKPGWAVSSEAYFLIYLVPEPRTIYVIRMQDVRRRLPAWRQIYPERTVATTDTTR